MKQSCFSCNKPAKEKFFLLLQESEEVCWVVRNWMMYQWVIINPLFLENILLRTNFSHHMASFHWQPAPRQHYHDFGKISSKTQKSSYLHKKVSKPIVQAQSTSSHFLAHDPSLWVLLGEFWELWFGEPRSMFSKTPVV